jgi:hypothetical protein
MDIPKYAIDVKDSSDDRIKRMNCMGVILLLSGRIITFTVEPGAELVVCGSNFLSITSLVKKSRDTGRSINAAHARITPLRMMLYV